jgi:hypothetical protein
VSQKVERRMAGGEFTGLVHVGNICTGGKTYDRGLTEINPG